MCGPASAEKKPNIILILIDDLGWKDLVCYGNEFVETHFYAAGAVCSPADARFNRDKIRQRDWKLIEYLDGSGDLELYHLSEDLSEKNNLAIREPETAASLKQRLKEWREKVLARIPLTNPGHDPKRAAEWWSLRTGKPVNSKSRQRFPQSEKNR